MRIWFLLFIMLCSAVAPVHATEAMKLLQLLSRGREEVIEPGLNAAEWRWLREHKKIRLAVWQPMSPPYDITTGLNDYGGINADFLGLIADNLNIEIEVQLYPDYDAALDALRSKKADFIGQAGDNQERQGLLLSKPYSKNVAVEVVNADELPDARVRTIAIAPVYDPDKVLARYPNAHVVEFSTVRHAMESLAFRNIDLFFCDAITARYLVSQSNLSNLSIRPVLPALHSAGFSFAAIPKMKIWIDILDKMLTAFPESANVEIHRRWNGGIPLSLSEQKPIFTSLEHKWIAEHSHIRVAVAEDQAPIAFFDEAGQLRGIIADILTALRTRTGFTFDIQRYPSLKDAMDSVKRGQSDLVAGATQEGVWQANLLTTRTWLYNSWVMVGRENYATSGQSQRVVSLRSEAPEAWLRRQGIGETESVDSWLEGLRRVARGDSDMMIVPLIVANSQLSQPACSSLRIVASIDTEPMRFAFGASRNSFPLVTILNKALINIPPEDLHALTRSGYAGNAFTSVRSGQPGSISLYLPYLIALAAIFVAIVFYVRRRAVLLRALDVIPTPAWLSDRRGRLIAGNPALQKALGTDSAALRGKPLVTWLPGVQEHNSGDTQIIRYADRVLQLWHAPVKGQRYLIGGWLDVTRQSQMIQALRTAKRKADSASRVKSVFLATMSHEIRTPISAIIGMLELVMRRRGDTEQNRQSVRIAWEAAQSLLLLIGNILDVSRIESGRLVLRPERASLRTLIESSAILFDGLAAQKGLRFMLEIDAGLNDDVLIDTMRFRQIIVNLVGNAIKFT